MIVMLNSTFVKTGGKRADEIKWRAINETKV